MSVRRDEAEALRWITDHIEKVGLHRGSLYDLPDIDEPTREELLAAPCCVLGAGLLYHYIEVAYSALEEVRRHIDENSIAHWSDETEKDEILVTLRRVADQLEAEVPA